MADPSDPLAELDALEGSVSDFHLLLLRMFATLLVEIRDAVLALAEPPA